MILFCGSEEAGMRRIGSIPLDEVGIPPLIPNSKLSLRDKMDSLEILCENLLSRFQPNDFTGQRCIKLIVSNKAYQNSSMMRWQTQKFLNLVWNDTDSLQVSLTSSQSCKISIFLLFPSLTRLANFFLQPFLYDKFSLEVTSVLMEDRTGELRFVCSQHPELHIKLGHSKFHSVSPTPSFYVRQKCSCWFHVWTRDINQEEIQGIW